MAQIVSPIAGLGHNSGPKLEAPKKKLLIPQKLLPIYQPWRHVALYGGRGGAKSFTISEAIILESSKVQHRVVCCRQFQNSIRESSKALLEFQIDRLGLQAVWHITDRELVNIKNGSRITFIGLDRNPESIKSLEGATICWVEEARLVKQEALEVLIPTIRARGSKIYWSWNPKFSTDPVDEYFRGSVRPENSFIQKVTYQDNPYFYQTALPSEMRFMKRLDLQKYHYIWGGEYDETGETRIFNNWKEGRVRIPDGNLPLFGLDFGYAQDPTVLIRLHLIESIKTIYITHERYSKRCPNRDIPELIEGVPDVDSQQIVGDSSRPETIEELCFKGFNVVGSTKGAGSVKHGIEFIQGYQVVIDPDCVHMLDAAKGYKWIVDPKTDKVTDKPHHDESDCWDAVRYALQNYSNSQGTGRVMRGKV